MFSVLEMYRISVQPTSDQNCLYNENNEVCVSEDSKDGTEDEVELGGTIQSHQIVTETEDMIEINLSHGEDAPAKKKSPSKQAANNNLQRATISSNDQLVAATSAMANGASIIYMLQVIFVVYPINTRMI